MADVISSQALSDLIGSIYDCALDPSCWEQTLADVMHAFDCQMLALGLTDLRQNRILLNRTVGFEPYQIEQHSKHLPEVHATLGEALASQASLDEAHVASRHLTAAYFETSPFWQEWVRPNGFIDIMTLFLMHTPTHFSLFGVGWNERQGLITEREIELDKLLLPHLRRAVTISKALDVRTIVGERMAEALDALRCAVVLTNEHGTILHANRPAGRCWTRAAPFKARKASCKRQLHQPHPSCAPPSPLRPATRPASAKPGWPSASPSPTCRPSLLTSCRSPGAISARGCSRRLLPAVFIGAPPDAQDGADTLAAAFGLTLAETRVLASLFGGRTLNETAATLGITRPTAKTHLEHIFSKTGVTRQAELMRLWTGPISLTGSNM
jgi:DNA-binding CsgD family transcriptional regulator/PAS domain-containing protein